MHKIKWEIKLNRTLHIGVFSHGAHWRHLIKTLHSHPVSERYKPWRKMFRKQMNFKILSYLQEPLTHNVNLKNFSHLIVFVSFFFFQPEWNVPFIKHMHSTTIGWECAVSHPRKNSTDTNIQTSTSGGQAEAVTVTILNVKRGSQEVMWPPPGLRTWGPFGWRQGVI